MYKNIKRMDQIRELLKHYYKYGKYKFTSRVFKVSKNTVKGYVSKIKKSGQSIETVLMLTDEQLCKLIYGDESTSGYNQREDFEKQIDSFLKQLPKVGVTRKLLWESYRESNPTGYGYSQFCERINQALAHRKISLPMDHNPGEVIQIDFTGKKLHWIDESGKDQFSEVLVFVFPYSQYVFCMALQSQKIPDFISGINSAFKYFGGIPKVLLSDNLRSYVTKSDRYQPEFNQSCVQLACYYDVELRATRVAHPKDKASVENAVRQCYTRVYTQVQNKEYRSIEQLNEAMVCCVDKWNITSYQKRKGCRITEFETYEQQQLRPLPGELFCLTNSTRAKVQRNYHVFLGQDKVFYSVPYKYIGKKVQIVYDHKTVQVYYNGQRIAMHKRLLDVKPFHYHTIVTHMPESHRAYKQQQLMSVHDYLDKIANQNVSTHWAIKYMYKNQTSEYQRQQACNKLLSLIRSYKQQRVENASKRCKMIGHVNCKMIENILKRNLDTTKWVDNNSDEFIIPEHDNIRGAQQYQ